MQEMTMEQVLSNILKLESEAKEIVKTQTDRRDALPSEVGRKLAEMRAGYLEKAARRVDEIRAEEKSRLDSELAMVRADHEKQMNRLSDVAESESENFADEIFRRVVGIVPDTPSAKLNSAGRKS